MKLNETPIRTSKNFNINNIDLDNINIPQIEHDNIKLKYGVGTEITSFKPTVEFNIDDDREIVFELNKENPILVDHINISVADTASIIIKYVSKEEFEYFHSGIIKVKAKENAVINIVIINFINQISNNFISIQNEIETNAKVNFTIVDFGGKNSITNYYSNMKGDSSQNNLNTIYLGKNNQLFDLNYIGHLYGQKSNINIEVQGALNDNSKKHFKGTIDFKKGSKKSIGNENESCMLLSNTAKSISLPMLLCSEEDVEGNHSCSAGKIGEKELFYIMSRGFSCKEAMQLMVKAKFNNIIEKIYNKELQKEILNEIDNRMEI